MFSLWSEFLRGLHQPEYVHVLLNPLPIYGLAMALLTLVLALVFRSRGAQGIALALIVVTAAAAWPVAYYGSAGYDRVYSMSDASASSGSTGTPIWPTASSGALCRGSARRRHARRALEIPRWHRPALILTVVATLTAVSLGSFLAFVAARFATQNSVTIPLPPGLIPAPDED